MKLNELKNRMPDAIRDVDYFNHIVIAQNDEIIRLLKKLTGEEDTIIKIEGLSTEVAVMCDVPVQEEAVVKPKTKRKKKAEVE